ncbi:hypothetical protein [Neorhizobium galegae]|uniref:hypothetical protein n=1 Tax=Neorhizobium galegae TaxID=399 RepID=UPI000627ACA3|nr:hypothetical protein [Neorhizobium galegae]KAB1122716.1 hypothetical protein F4V90_18580 [Neorhizobium galegae]MCQ1570312.1 hypothetical protein [Neorhizobium galegae]MCQ1807847.1 hypothetical protein [Neorhizobium galegae]
MPGLRLHDLIAIGMLLTSPALAADDVLVDFHNGTGPRAVGVIEGNEEVEPSGPAAISVGDDGTIYVLDQNNGRVLAVDGQRAQAEPEILALPAGSTADDLAVVNNEIFVWSDGVVALENSGDNGQSRQLRASGGEADEYTRSVFASMGSVTPGPINSVFEEIGRSAGRPAERPTVTQYVPSRGLGEIVAQVSFPSEKRAEMLLRRATSEDSFMALSVTTEGQLGLLELLDIDTSGRSFAMAEIVPSAENQTSGIVVARFSPDGKIEQVYDLPISDKTIFSRRFVTIGPRGDVLFLRSEIGRTQVLRLAGRPAKGVLTLPKIAQIKDRPREGKAPNIAVVSKSRSQVIERAVGFEALRWTVTPSAYGRAINCANMNRIRQPAFIIGRVGQTVKGVPYCWGCKTPLESFSSELAKGRTAGNVCTKSAPQQRMVGVDCSAFVSDAWGLKMHVTTRGIPGIARRVADPWSMKPGDALNKAGSHVMLFMRYTEDRKVEVMEASPNACKGRVCRNTYSLGTLLMRGYKPVRFKGLDS